MNPPILALIIPCYNEEKVLPYSARALKGELASLVNKHKISGSSFICFVDDGSVDNSWDIICQLNQEDSLFKGIKLSANRGQQQAILAGLERAQNKSTVTISMDADLQDKVSIIESFIDQYHLGNEIVYGVRRCRKVDPVFKRWSAMLFYSLLSLFGVKIVCHHADCRLASAKALSALLEYREVNLFLRGIFPLIGLQSSIVEYDRIRRHVGDSKYTAKKMISLAIDAITSFSVVPLRLVTFAGIFAFIVVCSLSAWAILQKMNGHVVVGWSSTIISIYLLGAVQLVSLGVIGEYVGKIYLEVKSRPRYFVDKELL